MKRICIVSATRAEYGLLRWTIEALRGDPRFDVRFIVTGTHLRPEFGETWKQIEADGTRIDLKIDYMSEDRSPEGIAREMSVCASMFAKAFGELSPDLVMVLGDRCELLPICSSALLMGIPIAHIAGGEHTEGAIDDAVRNAVTMMATLHFTNSPEAEREVIRMTGRGGRIYEVGEPGIENYLKLDLPGRDELSETLGLDASKDWYLCTLHPETRLRLQDNLQMASSMMHALQELRNAEIVVSEANSDYGGKEMNDHYRSCAGGNIHVFKSLGQRNYLGMVREARCVVGNSSSGMIETPYLGTPTINIGRRQKGRRGSANIVNCEGTYEAVSAALKGIGSRFEPDLSFGDGHTSQHIAKYVKEYFDEF